MLLTAEVSVLRAVPAHTKCSGKCRVSDSSSPFLLGLKALHSTPHQHLPMVFKWMDGPTDRWTDRWMNKQTNKWRLYETLPTAAAMVDSLDRALSLHRPSPLLRPTFKKYWESSGFKNRCWLQSAHQARWKAKLGSGCQWQHLKLFA